MDDLKYLFNCSIKYLLRNSFRTFPKNFPKTLPRDFLRNFLNYFGINSSKDSVRKSFPVKKDFLEIPPSILLRNFTKDSSGSFSKHAPTIDSGMPN